MKCSITKQIVTDNKVIIHVVLNKGHTFLALWMGATALDAPFSQLLCIKSAVMTRESTVFEALRVLSVLLITMFTQMPVAPKHTAATQGLFKLDLNIYWHSRWTSSSDCSASAMGGTFLQWFTWTHVALSATFTAVCVTRGTWKGPTPFSISSSFSCDHESPRNHQVWPRAGISQQPSAFTCTEIFDNRQDISLQ